MIQTLQSTNFNIQFDPTIFPNSPKRAQALLGVVENEFTVLTNWFNINAGFGPGNRVTVGLNMADGSGANNNGYATGGNSTINLDAQDNNTNDADAAERVKMLFVAEFVEVLMSYNNQNGPQTWNAGDSNGEGLSQLCSIERFRTGHYSYYIPWINQWLQWPPPLCPFKNPPPLPTVQRKDWITQPEATDKDCYSFGSALLFLYYLHSQLGHSIPEIIQKGGKTLEQTFQNLGHGSGAYNALTTLLNQYLPIGQTSALPNDDPFPLLDVSHRQLYLNPIVAPNGTPTHLSGGETLEQFLGCGPRKYHYDINSTPMTLTCVASNIGFGQPVYSWQVNGVAVNGTGQIQPAAAVFVDDPTNAQGGITTMKNVPIDCILTSDAVTSTLVMNFPSTIGHIDLIVEVDAIDSFFQPTSSSTAKRGIVVSTENLVWEPKYYQDAKHCRDEFINRFRQLAPPFDRLNEAVAILLTLPDPPLLDYFRALRQIENMATFVDRIGREVPPEIARELYGLFERRLALSPMLAAQILPAKQ